MKAKIAAIVLISSPSYAGADGSFNLVCTGTQKTMSMAPDEIVSYTDVYRIDLDNKKWCEAECKAVHDIASVQPTVIVLAESKVDTPSERSMVLHSIDRETGAHSFTSTYSNPRYRLQSLLIRSTGQCQRAPFSGFPKFETKF